LENVCIDDSPKASAADPPGVWLSSVDAEALMDGMPTAEARAANLVGVGREGPSGGFYIILRNPGGGSVYLGPYANRDVAKLEANRIRGFVAAVIREVGAERSEALDIGEPVAWTESTTVIPPWEIRSHFRPSGRT
jgi:hypothetical protein